jgi:hypothetical protein
MFDVNQRFSLFFFWASSQAVCSLRRSICGHISILHCQLENIFIFYQKFSERFFLAFSANALEDSPASLSHSL